MPAGMPLTTQAVAAEFWRSKSLAEMNTAEWEALCDGCGRCCLHKLEDETTQEIFYTDVACRYLNLHTCRCRVYPKRLQKEASCMQLTLAHQEAFAWLPPSCAYRLLYEGQDLPWWHPLKTGQRESVHEAGISVRHAVVSETDVAEDELEEHIIYWVDTP
ncbi:hypothetical protein SAMN05421831_101357 [Allopseudospirillum japonicum]|uniref:UPF0260 protein SAMN05421831_101357 n=1 Tax=Allopseudospirillum japonicum TaxID=64971 RepID=A0A1H6QPC1_9GAMM|nr:YcgN family cysteine cluster protein [Allopseudospirillum japonicum]SEI41105.1 hypothetical protein SAMN05421831_101357 [Allopseudospirillum japonicum]